MDDFDDFDFDLHVDTREEWKKASDNSWRTLDGRVVAISEMHDNHLENVILLLERRGIQAFVLPPDHPEYELIQTLAQMTGVKSDSVPRYQNLLKERERRRSLRLPVQVSPLSLPFELPATTSSFISRPSPDLRGRRK